MVKQGRWGNCKKGLEMPISDMILTGCFCYSLNCSASNIEMMVKRKLRGGEVSWTLILLLDQLLIKG